MGEEGDIFGISCELFENVCAGGPSVLSKSPRGQLPGPHLHHSGHHRAHSLWPSSGGSCPPRPPRPQQSQRSNQRGYRYQKIGNKESGLHPRTHPGLPPDLHLQYDPR